MRRSLNVSVVELGDGARLARRERPHVDPLRERDPEARELARADAPAPLPKEVVVEQDDISGVRPAAPDVRDGLLLADDALGPRHDAERTAEAAPALREPDGRPEARIQRVVLPERRYADPLERRPAHLAPVLEVPAGSAHDRVRVDLEQPRGKRLRPLEDERGVDTLRGVEHLPLESGSARGERERDRVASLAMVRREPHARDGRPLAVQLEDADPHGASPPKSGR